MSLYVKKSSLSYDYDDASRRDRLVADGWEECGCENGRVFEEAEKGTRSCSGCADGLVPPEGMVEAAAKTAYQDDSTVVWDDAAAAIQGMHRRWARAALIAAARWEAADESSKEGK